MASASRSMTEPSPSPPAVHVLPTADVSLMLFCAPWKSRGRYCCCRCLKTTLSSEEAQAPSKGRLQVDACCHANTPRQARRSVSTAARLPALLARCCWCCCCGSVCIIALSSLAPLGLWWRGCCSIGRRSGSLGATERVDAVVCKFAQGVAADAAERPCHQDLEVALKQLGVMRLHDGLATGHAGRPPRFWVERGRVEGLALDACMQIARIKSTCDVLATP